MVSQEQVQPVALIQIALMPDQTVRTNCANVNRQLFNMMVETAKQDVVQQMQQAEAKVGKVQVPPPLAGDRFRMQG